MKDDGGPAYACAAENGHQLGMSLRDAFAIAALQGMATHPSRVDIEQIESLLPTRAALAYAYADAMIAERNKN